MFNSAHSVKTCLKYEVSNYHVIVLQTVSTLTRKVGNIRQVVT